MRRIVGAVLVLLSSLSHAQNSDDGSKDFLPWQDSPNVRGTMDIIWTCVFTILVCVWTVVHMNVPAPPNTDTTVKLWLRRLKWVGNCCMVPEIVLLLAAGQWSFARVCWREMRQILAEQDEEYKVESGELQPKAVSCSTPSLTHPALESKSEDGKQEMSRPKLRRSETFEQYQKRESDERWTLRHAFYANMGGFRLQDKTGRTFLVSAKHINYLVRQKYIALPSITPLEINDRSKSDSLAKFLAIMQVGWLAVQVVARTIQNLETTLLEITTLSFIVCTIGTFIAWFRKPYDVQTFVLLNMPNHAVGDINLKFTQKDGTERDLLGQYIAEHRASNVVDGTGDLLAPYNKLAIIDDGLPTFTSSFTDVYGHLWGRRPYDPDRIRNDRLPVMEKSVTLVCAVTTLAYAGLHIAGWNVPLVTNIEQLLWRISSLTMMGCVFAWFFMDHFEEYLEYRRARRGIVSNVIIVPWWRIPASIIVAIVYSICRLYVLVESFVALRELPPSAYQQVDWGRWLPHI
ncbi:hypothetical protein H2200_013450 [Cladophialophora chaetospira]|uniref:Uncharacterized protein n=1 Tax=Cladophialophora chaetospira TaxID=386627 RepID=A0AA38TXI4_9EURO|nr:hypothetical protein H2200_013450 [Cladophialophora chaetospira]